MKSYKELLQASSSKETVSQGQGSSSNLGQAQNIKLSKQLSSYLKKIATDKACVLKSIGYYKIELEKCAQCFYEVLGKKQKHSELLMNRSDVDPDLKMLLQAFHNVHTVSYIHWQDYHKFCIEYIQKSEAYCLDRKLNEDYFYTTHQNYLVKVAELISGLDILIEKMSDIGYKLGNKIKIIETQDATESLVTQLNLYMNYEDFNSCNEIFDDLLEKVYIYIVKLKDYTLQENSILIKQETIKEEFDSHISIIDVKSVEPTRRMSKCVLL